MVATVPSAEISTMIKSKMAKLNEESVEEEGEVEEEN